MKIPKGFASLQGMGRVIDVYPLRQRFWARWGPIFLALAAFLGCAAVLLYGLYAAYLKYYKFGPAIVGKTLMLPLVIAGVLALIAVLAGASAYIHWPKSAAFFEQGFAYRDRRGIHTWRWEEIASLRSEVIRHTALGIDTGVTHRFILMRLDGRRLVLNDDLERVELLAGNIREMVVPRLYDQCAGAFNLGREIDFARISVSKAEGIKWGDKMYPWSLVGEVTLHDGILRISPADAKSSFKGIRIRASKIPNLEVLLSIMDQIVGVKVGVS